MILKQFSDKSEENIHYRSWDKLKNHFKPIQTVIREGLCNLMHFIFEIMT